MAVLNFRLQGNKLFKKTFFSDIPWYSLNTLHSLTVRHCHERLVTHLLLSAQLLRGRNKLGEGVEKCFEI